MAHWIRFAHEGQEGFGTIEGDLVRVHRGAMFEAPEATDRRLPLAEVELLTPTRPTKLVGLWNNFHALATKLGSPVPEEPLYFLKATTSCLAPGGVIRRPRSYSGKVVYEGELGIVIGRTCREASAEEAAACIFGYTCVNDVTAADLISKDPTFPQWARAKGFDGFGPFGPAIATDLPPEGLVVRTILNGQERQSYPVSDMIFPPHRLVSLLSHMAHTVDRN